MIPHKHLLVRAQISNAISNTNEISSWILNLVESIDMKILHGPNTVYCDKEGNRGITSFAIIETSHIALHIWDETNPATLQLDVYTCSNLQIEKVFSALSIFDPTTIEYKFLDREQGFKDITQTPESAVEKWVAKITKKNSNLGDHKICPFANTPSVVAVDKLSIDSFSNLDNNVTVYMETKIASCYQELENLCKQLKQIYPQHVFLPDHPCKPNYINGQETGNGIFPCIIVQTRKELCDARAVLEKTDYYSYWDEDYLQEIKSFT